MGQLELDDLTEELSEEEGDGTIDEVDSDAFDEDDANQIEAPLNTLIDMEKIYFAYLPCCAHNFQLVLKDGFLLDKVYEALLKRIDKMVSKSKASSIVAEELRNLDKFLCKSIPTRWNSILFLIRSILKLNSLDLAQIRNNMPTSTKKQREAKELFRLSVKEREMLSELRNLLVSFEFVTNELQTNEISISRVFPCYLFLKERLEATTYKVLGNNVETTYNYVHTVSIKKALAASLEKRFASLIENNDVFIISTLLDPNFGKRALPLAQRASAINLLKIKLIKHSTRVETLSRLTNELEKQKVLEAEQARQNNYLVFDEEEINSPLNDLDSQIKEYFLLIENNKYNDALLFWRLHHKSPSFVNLAKLAQKYLGVPATSAAVERMFSISGHILNNKRRTTGVQLYEDLVFCKLNEELII